MSSTRYAPAGAPIAYEKYMSSPQYAQLRGIPGTVVAAKAQLYLSARKRSLLFFLQSLSLKNGGLRLATRDLLQMFPSQSEEELARFLTEICINPKLVVEFSSSAVFDAIREFQDRYEANVKADFVFTTIGRQIFETLDHALAIGKMVVIEGESGTGKTTAAEAWCAAHQGQVRFVSLSGITHKSGFFQKISSAIGLASSQRTTTEMQIRVEEFFRRTRLMLVIDEAHYLYPQHQHRSSSPELVNWVNTALVNHQVPVALICTDQFAKLKERTEKRTGWTSEQLEHRVKRYKKLPSTPTKEDLEAVAAKLLPMRWSSDQEEWNVAGPKPPRDFVKMIVGYALTCKMRLPAVSNTIQEARYQARTAGRSHIVGADLRTALLDYQIPSDEALQRAFETSPSRSSSSVVRKPQLGVRRDSAIWLQSRCS